MVHATNNLTYPIVHALFSYLSQGYHVYSMCPDIIFKILLPPSRPMTSHHVPLYHPKEKKRKRKRNSKEKKYKIKKNR